MTVAIRPSQSLVPYTDGELAFTSGNPPVGSGLDEADDPDSGRANNHGFEGLAISTVCCLLVIHFSRSCNSLPFFPLHDMRIA